MKTDLEEKIELPEGTEVSYSEATVTIKGPRGELQRPLHHPKIIIESKEGSLLLKARQATLREKKVLFTFKAHVKNMVEGVTEGFTYRLKICSGHFPMTVAVKNGRFEVKNFIGEKVPRTLLIKEGVDVKVDGEQVTVTGNNKELVGQVASDIEQLTRRTGFDSRIFQDGIFITEKSKKKV